MINLLKTLLPNNNAIIYARISTPMQKPNRQIQDLTKFSKEKGYDIKKVFVESGSGKLENDQRPLLMEMLNYVICNNIKHVLITESSRLSRSISEIKKIISLFKTYKVNIFIQNININTLYEFDYSILEESVRMASYEVNLLKSRLSSGYDEYIRNGGRVGRKVGSKKTNKKILHENENVVNLLKDGYSIRKISRLTNKSTGLVLKIKKILENQEKNRLNEDIYKVIDVRADELYPYASKLKPEDVLGHNRLCINSKLNAILPYINTSKGKTILYTNFHDGIDKRIFYYLEENGFNSDLYTKSKNKEDRKHTLKKFINGDLDVLIISQPMINEIHGLEKISDRIIILSLPSTNFDLIQLVKAINKEESPFLETGVEVIIPLVSINGLEHSFRWDYKLYNSISYKEDDLYLDIIKNEIEVDYSSEEISNPTWIRKLKSYIHSLNHLIMPS